MDASGMKKGASEAQKALMSVSASASSLTRTITLPFLAAGAAAVKSFADIEKMQIGLSAVMGSASAADTEFKKLVETSKQPGLGLTQTIDASLSLQAMGTSAERSRRIIEGLGKATAFSGKGAAEFERAMWQLQDVMKKGSIETADLKILMGSIPALGQLMTKAFGTTSAELIRANFTVEEFVTKLTDAAHQLPITEEMANSLSNQFSNMSDEIKIAGAEMGKAIVKSVDLKGILSDLSSSVSGAASWFGKLEPSMQSTIVKSGLLLAAVGPIVKGFTGLMDLALKLPTALGLTAKSLGTLGKSFGIVGVAIAGTHKLLSKWYDSVNTPVQKNAILAIAGPGFAQLLKLREKLGGGKDDTAASSPIDAANYLPASMQNFGRSGTIAQAKAALKTVKDEATGAVKKVRELVEVMSLPGNEAFAFMGSQWRENTSVKKQGDGMDRHITTPAALAGFSGIDRMAGKLVEVQPLLGKMTEQTQAITGFANSMGDAFVSAFDQITAGGFKFGEFMKEMFLGIIKQAIKALIVTLALKVLSGGTDLGKMAFGDLFKSVLGGGLGLPKTASGGIVNGPQHRIVGEAGPEAIIPLNRGSSRSMFGGSSMSAVIRGQDLHLVARMVQHDSIRKGTSVIQFT